MKRIICWLFGHKYDITWRFKYYTAWSNGCASRKNQRFKTIDRGKWKAKYCQCKRCSKRITLPEAEARGLYHPYRKPHYINL